MWRFSTVMSALLMLCLALVVLAAPAFSRVEAQSALQAPRQPLVTCSYAPVTLTLTGSGNIEDVRPFTTAAGESYFQFAPVEPLTTTISSSGAALLNGNSSGSVSGG